MTVSEIRAEFRQHSAIALEVCKANIKILEELEIDPATKEVVGTPIHEALGWKYTRFGHQARPNMLAAQLLDEKGQTWQLKVFGADKTGKRTGQYYAPKGIGDVPYLPAIPRQIVLDVCEEYGVEPPEEGQLFWDWIQDHPEIPVIVTEGAKKALSAISQGYIALALWGCSCGFKDLTVKESLLPYVTGRPVTIAYDQDPAGSKASRKVFHGINRLARNLKFHAKSTVKIAEWDGADGKGIDDLIANDPAKFRRAIALAIPLEDFQIRQYTDLSQWVNQTRWERYWSDLNAPESAQIIGIGGAKGTGKTEALSREVAADRAKGRKTFALVHRVQLGHQLADRLGLDYQTEVRESETQGVLGIVFTIDQILRHAPEKFYGENMIFDEAQQSLWELLDSDRGNLGKHKVAILDHLKECLKQCIEGGGKIYLCDADLNPITIKYIKGLIGGTVETYIVVNKFLPASGKRKLFVYDSPEELVASAIKAVSEGKKIQLVTGAQKAGSKYSSTNLGKLFETELPGKRVKVLDAVTVADPKSPAYNSTGNLDAFLADCDVLINTSVVETGVSIDKPYFDAVYAIGQGTQTVEQFCQGIERYRPDAERHIFVRKSAPNGSLIANGETSPRGLLKTEEKKAGATMNLLARADRLSLFEEESPEHLKTWATLAAIHNQGKKKYRETILKKLEADGYEIIHVVPEAPSEEMTEDTETEQGILPGQVEHKIVQIRDASYAQETEAIAAASNPDPITYEQLKRKQSKTESERYQERKGDLCRALHTHDISPEDVRRCDDGWIAQLTLHYFFQTGKEFLQKRDAKRIKERANEAGKVLTRDVNRRTLSLKIEALRLLGFDRFFSGIGEFSKESLAEWWETIVLPLRGQIRQILGVTINVEKDNPIAFVQRVLKKMGLSLTYLGRFGERGNQVRVYGPVNPDPDGRTDIFERWLKRDAILYQTDTVSTESLISNQA